MFRKQCTNCGKKIWRWKKSDCCSHACEMEKARSVGALQAISDYARRNKISEFEADPNRYRYRATCEKEKTA